MTTFAIPTRSTEVSVSVEGPLYTLLKSFKGIFHFIFSVVRVRMLRLGLSFGSSLFCENYVPKQEGACFDGSDKSKIALGLKSGNFR